MEKPKDSNGNQMVFEVLGRQTIEIYALRAEVLRLRRELEGDKKKKESPNATDWDPIPDAGKDARKQ